MVLQVGMLAGSLMMAAAVVVTVDPPSPESLSLPFPVDLKEHEDQWVRIYWIREEQRQIEFLARDSSEPRMDGLKHKMTLVEPVGDDAPDGVREYGYAYYREDES